MQIGNGEVISALIEYKKLFEKELADSEWLFVNRLNHRLSEQSVQFMINNYVELAGIEMHITPHMFRHSYVKPTTKKFNYKRTLGIYSSKILFL